MRTSRIRSFTLIEMVLAMLFSAIVVGIGYTSITIFSKLYENYRLKRSTQSDLQIVEQALTRDLSRSLVVECEMNKIYLRDSANAFTLHYIVDENYLIRIAKLKTDSIRMENLSFKCFFEGHAVEKGILDQVILNFESENFPTMISSRKEYSAEELFNYDDSVKRLNKISAP